MEPIAGEEVVDAVEVAAAEQEIASVAFDHGAAAACTDPVGGDGAEVRGERSDGGEQDQLPLGVGERVAGERHDDFGRDGDAGGLDGHQQHDRAVATDRDQADEQCEDFFTHVGMSLL